MSDKSIVNDMVVRFANVNGTGSASANGLFAKAVFRMGIPATSKNIFPSNIQGLPTWFEVRINEQGYLGRRDGIDVVVAINPQSFKNDVDGLSPGGYFIYDNSKPLHKKYLRSDIHYVGIPMMLLSMEHYANPRIRQLLKNVIYIGALAALLDMDMDILRELIAEQFERKPKLIPDNYKALALGCDYVREHYDCPITFRLKKRKLTKGKIVMDGNTATALGLLYGGASVAAWYPITPSTSVTLQFQKYANKYRKDPKTGKLNVAIVQAEDELAAMGMVIGACWNGARAFTATSGAGVSLMNELIGLAYFAEIPVSLINVQRGGPSTGMPTRSQQSDLISSAYASHGDTKHILLIPSNPKECFEFASLTLDLADRLQTPVILMSDLDLGMNDHLTDELEWDDDRTYDRGKVLTAEQLEEVKEFGRYLDVDGDGIPYRTYPGTHPTKGSFFTRGTSHDEFARYTETGAVYLRKVNRLLKKFETAKTMVPKPEFYQDKSKSKNGLVFFGTTTYAAIEVMDRLKKSNIALDSMRLRSFPFSPEVKEFIDAHEEVYIVEQNRDGQMRSLIINELEIVPQKLISILNYDGVPITADAILAEINTHMTDNEMKMQAS